VHRPEALELLDFFFQLCFILVLRAALSSDIEAAAGRMSMGDAGHLVILPAGGVELLPYVFE
jgi:hypothetical protein